MTILFLKFVFGVGKLSTQIIKPGAHWQKAGGMPGFLTKSYCFSVSFRGATIHDLGVSIYCRFCIMIQRYIVRYSKV